MVPSLNICHLRSLPPETHSPACNSRSGHCGGSSYSEESLPKIREDLQHHHGIALHNIQRNLLAMVAKVTLCLNEEIIKLLVHPTHTCAGTRTSATGNKIEFPESHHLRIFHILLLLQKPQHSFLTVYSVPTTRTRTAITVGLATR